MKIKFSKEIYIPSGMYCTNCIKLDCEDIPEYRCTEFPAQLICTKTGAIVKCDACLLACAASLRGE